VFIVIDVAINLITNHCRVFVNVHMKVNVCARDNTFCRCFRDILCSCHGIYFGKLCSRAKYSLRKTAMASN